MYQKNDIDVFYAVVQIDLPLQIRLTIPPPLLQYNTRKETILIDLKPYPTLIPKLKP